MLRSNAVLFVVAWIWRGPATPLGDRCSNKLPHSLTSAKSELSKERTVSKYILNRCCKLANFSCASHHCSNKKLAGHPSVTGVIEDVTFSQMIPLEGWPAHGACLECTNSSLSTDTLAHYIPSCPCLDLSWMDAITDNRDSQLYGCFTDITMTYRHTGNVLVTRLWRVIIEDVTFSNVILPLWWILTDPNLKYKHSIHYDANLL